AVRHWVTYHGFAMNVTDEPLRAFRKLSPCGLPGAVMTSLEACRPGAAPPTPAEVADVVAREPAAVLPLERVERPAAEARGAASDGRGCALGAGACVRRGRSGAAQCAGGGGRE